MSLLDTASLILTPNGYKASKLYSVKPTDASGDMVVTRNTTATRVNSAGLIETVAINVPRLDYPPLGGCPSILSEPARTNLFTYSNTFTDASWTKLNCSITANNTTSPDGSVNASKLTSNTTNNNFLFKAVTAANGIYTFSCFVKYFDTDTINISLTDFVLGQAFGTFNFTTGTFTSSGVSGGGAWTNTTTNVITLLNGWFKISITSQKNAGTVVNSRIDTFVNETSVYIYGAQLEAGTNATSYIPTTTAQITRTADSSNTTGLSSLIGQLEGTIYAEILVKQITQDYLICALSLTGQSVTNSVVLTVNNIGKLVAQVYASSVSIVNPTAFVVGDIYKVAFGYKSGNSVMFVNGGQVSITDTDVFNLTTLNAVSLVNSGYYVTGGQQAVKSIVLFKTRLTNAQLATLTTL